MTMTPTNQTPGECKHYNNGACAVRNNTKCLNTYFSVRYGYQKPSTVENCLSPSKQSSA